MAVGRIQIGYPWISGSRVLVSGFGFRLRIFGFGYLKYYGFGVDFQFYLRITIRGPKQLSPLEAHYQP